MKGSAVIAVGGNSLVRAGEKGTIPEQLANARIVGRAIAHLMDNGLHVAITHGNGPQVGAQLLRSERTAGQAYEQGLDVCVAATQGEIGYILQQGLQDALRHAGCKKLISTILTQIVVNEDDPAFGKPTKPIGPFYSRTAAEEKTRELGWDMIEDASRGYRRVVPSPIPIEIVEAEVIRAILDRDILVIAAGGGGIPVVRRECGTLVGVDAVIDKDRASLLLACQLKVDRLVFSTDADHVYLKYRQPGETPLERVTVSEIMRHHAAGEFPPGSMGPKVEAAVQFVRCGGQESIITSLDHLAEAVMGDAGTHILPDPRGT